MFLQRILERNKEKLTKYEQRSSTRLATILDPRYDSCVFTDQSNYNQAKALLRGLYSNFLKDNGIKSDHVTPATQSR